MRPQAAPLPLADHGDIRFWTPDQAARTPLPRPPAINVLDLRGLAPDPALVHPSADLLLVDCAPAWTAVAPAIPSLAIPATAEPAEAPARVPAALHLLLGPHPGERPRHLASVAAAWAARAGLPCGVLAPASLAEIARFGAARAEPGIVLDLREGTHLLTEPLALVQAMADGSPVVFCEPSPCRDGLARAGAGRAVSASSLADLSSVCGPAFPALSAAALAHIGERHSRPAALAALDRGLAAARERRDHHLAHWPRRTTGIFVLVVSSEALNLLDIRVHLPFAALRAQGAIAGYAILRHGDYVFSTEPISPATRFGALWVQRSQDPLVELLLETLDQPFVYDLDDLLLVSPGYREPFGLDSTETARSLVRRSRVLSCGTSRLAVLAQAHEGEGAVAKAVVTPNLASGPAIAAAGSPQTVVWASSDQPALAASRREVERAVRDFCLAHGLRLLCLGAPPPALFAAAGLLVEHVALLPYAAYLERLRAAAPGILLAPLETAADPATQDFVDAKSDIKVLEAGMAGLVGVFSRAAPYTDSDLGPEILCDNTYESWLQGLERARAACIRGQEARPFPAARNAGGIGALPWAEALARVRSEFTGADVAAAIRGVRAHGETLLAAPAAFDEADYLRRHDDVREAVAAGVVASGYRHYVQSGFGEGREARRLSTPDAAAAFWWSRLLHRVGQLERRTAERTKAIAQLGERVRDRAALGRDTPAPPGAEPADGIAWSPPGSISAPCPVCHSPGPHEKALAFMGETLAHCRICGTRFYERRDSYDYEDPGASDLLLQLNLEQNASIYHQTKPLFTVEGGASLLDVGCGFGFAVDLAASLLGWRAVGVDPSFYAEAGRTALGADIRQAYLAEATDLGATFDLVLASEVLEHLPAPSDFLALLDRHLAPGGTLVLTTPDADAIVPTIGPARLLAILAPQVHLVLFSRFSLARALQQAGFGHVRVTSAGDGLLAYASRRPLRFRGDADSRHDNAYRRYLASLLDRALPATPLWNGAAGRLLTWLTQAAPDETLEALFARIGKAWKPAYGLDLAAPCLPPPNDLRAHPFNLAPVLLARASHIARQPGRSPESILAYARPAYRIALQTGRALQAANMIDHDLRATAHRARMLALDALAELAPELEASLLAGLLQPSPGGLAEWADPAPDALAPRLAVAFATAVAAGQHDEARRLEPALGNLDRLCRILDGSDETLLRTLFALGVQRLLADADPHAALLAFRRMEAEARRRLHRGPAIADLLHLAEDHMTIATDRLRHPGQG